MDNTKKIIRLRLNLEEIKIIERALWKAFATPDNNHLIANDRIPTTKETDIWYKFRKEL